MKPENWNIRARHKRAVDYVNQHISSQRKRPMRLAMIIMIFVIVIYIAVEYFKSQTP